MTHHTDAERAEFEKLWAERPIYMGQDHQKELALHWWQAACRAPSMPDQSIIEAVDGWFARNTALGGCSDKDVAELAAIFAAAPQPPDAAQASVSNGTFAAPVQLPEPGINTANHAGIRVIGYTEQQVRELLANHGIKEQST